MPPKRTNKQPNFEIKMHIPATSWHPEYRKTVHSQKPTEFEAWAEAIRLSLMALTQGNGRLILGYILDLINTLPVELRSACIEGVVRGLGLQIKQVVDTPNTIEIGLIPRYPPLGGTPQAKGGLVVPPDTAKSGLILPGQS